MHDLVALLGPERTSSEVALAQRTTPRSIRRWLSSGRLVRLHPGWVTVPEWADDWVVRAYAATGYTGGTLSHTSALTLHGLIDEEQSRLHVTVPVVHRLRSTRRLRIHRSTRPCGVVPARRLPATPIARSLIDTWDDAHRGAAGRRAVDLARNAVFRAFRDKRVDAAQIEAELTAVPRLAHLTDLRQLLTAVCAGLHSELEILGVRALSAAGLPAPQLQYRIGLPLGSVRVDAAWPEVKLAVEFDGAAFHADRQAWQRDLQRDAALAALGWVVLRFSYADITRHPGRCAEQLAATYRRRCLDVPGADIPARRMSASGTAWAGG